MPPVGVSRQVLRIEVCDESTAKALEDRLREIPGVLEAVVIGDEGVAYVRVDRALNPDRLITAVAES